MDATVMQGTTVELVKEKLSIVDVVSPYVKLTHAGKYWRGLSPFTKEKTPSFFVNPDRGSYYCFSSSQGGDMFTFIEKMEGVDFKGALKILAEKAGVEIVYGGAREDHGKADRLREVMVRAEQFFAGHLSEDSAAYAYATSRGLTPETIRAWRLGYAPDEWRALLEHLGKLGFSSEELSQGGLIKEADGKAGTWYDRFRNRLMFPIGDMAGRTVAFTGRTLSSEEQAKYLNSPETDLFKKSHILFGMHKAKDAIRLRQFTLLVEGQMDLLQAHQAGFTNAVALSGTALSPEHISLIKRYSDNLMLCLDADRAGLAATVKHALVALAAGMRVKAVELPAGKDPADVILEDAKDFAKRVGEAKPIVEFFLSVLLTSEKDPHRLVMHVERIVLPLVRAIQSPMEREHFVGIVARAIASTPEAVRASLSKTTAAVDGPIENSVSAKNPDLLVYTPHEELFRAIRDNYVGTPLARRVETEYARIVGQPLPEEPGSERVLFETGILFGETPSEQAADDTLKAFEKATLSRTYQEALQALRVAERSGSADRIREAEVLCDKLAKVIAGLP
ncbi:MAG: DNA primase [Minisyncoccia bacterium]